MDGRDLKSGVEAMGEWMKRIEKKVAALEIKVEKFSSDNTGSSKCPRCGSKNIETRITTVCFEEDCHYLEMSRPLRAGS